MRTLLVSLGAALAWLSPVPLSSSDLAVGPELALTPTGEAVVVWDREVGAVCATAPENPACVHIVETVSRTPGSPWRPAAEVARPGVGSTPRVAIDPAGDAVAVWAHDIGRDRVLQASFRRGPAGQWQEPIDLSEPVLQITGQQVALDAAGDAVAVWAQRTDAGVVVEAELRPAASGAWGAPVALSGPALGEPSLAIDPGGDAHAAWVRTGGVVQASRRAASGPWEAPVDLGTGTGPEVALDAGGDAVAVWSGTGVQASFRPAGGAWDAPTAVSQSGTNPQVAVDAAGNAVTVWLDGGVVRGAARTRSTGSWTGPVDLGRGASDARVATDRAGNAVAVWTAGAVQAAMRPAASGVWQPAVDVSAPGASGPRVAMDTAGNALAVWARQGVVESAELRGTGPVLSGLSVPAAGTAHVPVSFAVDATPWASPLAGQPVWRFGDGGTASGGPVTHVYAAPGRYTVSVTGSDAGGGTATAGATIAIAAPTLKNVVRPAIRGRPRVGATLTCTRGTWAGTPPIRYAFAWLRNRRPIGGATQAAYRLRRADAGALLACRVRATNPGGSTTSTSRPVRVVP